MTLQLGTVYVTPCVMKCIRQNALCRAAVNQAIRRHARCDWGDLPAVEQQKNDQAVNHGKSVTSVYHYGPHRIFVVTEADRSATVVMCPEEY